jgi:ABC-type multidrug transport system fused ATPase/permease subunit
MLLPQVSFVLTFFSPDILILDDPTSSLDTKVTDQIFSYVTNAEPWSSKTFVVSTNNIKTFDYADKIIIIQKGKVEFFGTYDEMMSIKHLADMIEELKKAKGDSPEAAADNTDAAKKVSEILKLKEKAEQKKEEEDKEEVKKKKQDFFFKEKVQTGGISYDVIERLIEGQGGTAWFLFCYMVIPFVLIYAYLEIRKSSLEWGNEYFGEQGTANDRLMWMTLVWATVLAVFGFLKRILVHINFTWLGRDMHAKMIFRLLHSKINEFLKRVPLGQFINRFSNDIDTVDKTMGEQFYDLNFYFPKTLLNCYAIILGVQNWLNLVFLITYVLVAMTLRGRYMAGKREMMRLFQVSTSPVIGLGTASISGAPVIRCLGNQKYFDMKMSHLINENTKNKILEIGLDGWFEVSLCLFDFFLVLIPSYALVIYTLYLNQESGSDDADFTNFSLFLLLIVEFAKDFNILLNSMNNAESNSVSVERCRQFELIKPEKGYKTFAQDAKFFEKPKRGLKKCNQLLSQHRRKKIFNQGHIEIQNISARYPTGNKNVISNITMTIQAGEKVGIVGRTGAGKSSFIKLLWRGMTPYEGQIFIDGIDGSTLDLKDYREQFTVISQATNLFEGTIAENISMTPMNADMIRNTEAILRNLNFPAKKISVPNLGFRLETEASNLSEGEKQIISYVRGVYNKRKIVILDEASAYVDNKTEKGFRDLADSAFKDSTVLIIAHRIQSVLDCDKILVLGAGRVIEFDSPQNLLADPESEFSKICAKM